MEGEGASSAPDRSHSRVMDNNVSFLSSAVTIFPLCFAVTS